MNDINLIDDNNGYITQPQLINGVSGGILWTIALIISLKIRICHHTHIF
jgi:hypothetical protein